MTMGDNPQPLTRREARELARGQEPVSAAAEQKHSSSTEGQKAPRPRRAGTPEATRAGDAPQITTTQITTTPPELSQLAEVTDAAPAPPSFERRSNDVDSVSASMPSKRHPEPERGLTRRELRAKKSAEAKGAAEVTLAEVVDETPPADEEVGPGPLQPTVGHWSIDPDDDGQDTAIEHELPFEQLMARGIGAGGIPTTTNALILPSIPLQGTASGPLSSTGEILITGSIDLPRSLGATGQHPNHFDSSDADHLLDQLDEGAPTTNVAPVSASRAISTHASTRGLMTPPKKRGVSLPTVLAVTAAILAIGVLALFVAGYVFKIF